MACLKPESERSREGSHLISNHLILMTEVVWFLIPQSPQGLLFNPLAPENNSDALSHHCHLVVIKKWVDQKRLPPVTFSCINSVSISDFSECPPC